MRNEQIHGLIQSCDIATLVQQKDTNLRLLANVYMLWKYIGILHPLKWHEDYLKLKSLNKSPSKFLLLILKVPPQKYRCHKSLSGGYTSKKRS